MKFITCQKIEFNSFCRNVPWLVSRYISVVQLRSICGENGENKKEILSDRVYYKTGFSCFKNCSVLKVNKGLNKNHAMHISLFAFVMFEMSIVSFTCELVT